MRVSRAAQALKSRLLKAEDGFTLTEAMVAAVVLAVGVLGVIAIAFQASALTATNKAREGATNLAREVTETVASVRYSTVDPATIATVLQSKPGLAPVSGYSDWRIVRRQITYTVAVTACYVDDPSDGLGSHSGSFCSGSTGSSDSQPVDYKRVTVAVTWQRSGSTPHTVHESTVLAPRGGNDVPTITSLSSAAGVTITDPAVTSMNFAATTSAIPSGVAWLVDGGVRGLASGSGTTWAFTWGISGLSDGQYVVGAEAYNSSGSYGTPTSLTISLNRYAPTAPTNFVAGWNPSAGKVDAEWLANPERDLVGYTVYRRISGVTTKVNCGTTGSPVYITTQTSCSDAASTGAGPATYWVVAVDRDPSGNNREGPSSNSVADAYASNLAPNAISGSVNCTKNADSSSTLSWTQPSQPGDPNSGSGDHIAFDRIYRDGSRFDRTGLSSDNTYTDALPGGTHTYYLKTVDTHLAESTSSATVTC